MCLQPGEFFMGSPSTEVGRGVDEARHRVILTKHVLMTATEVTQALWLQVMGYDISDCGYGCGDDFPAQNLDWENCLEFSNALSDDVGLTEVYSNIQYDEADWDEDADGWRLPTEAEWEYAARAGESFLYSGSDTLALVGWCNGADDPYDGTEVASLAENAWGFVDMSGNVAEWVWDIHENYVAAEATDPTGAAWGSDRVARGGTYAHDPADCRVAARANGSPGTSYWNRGFRIARTLQ